MEFLAHFFESINNYLGVKSPGELVVNPYFIGFIVIMLAYSILKGWRLFTVAILGGFGTGMLIKYMYPADTSDLLQLVKFLGCMGGLGLLLIYFAFIRE
ncbi:MAG: hypothetical protein V2B18_07475 [Pseudomonadota bacterium]